MIGSFYACFSQVLLYMPLNQRDKAVCIFLAPAWYTPHHYDN